MFTLGSEITIGGKRFDSVNRVVVRRSVHTPAATATINVPVSAVLRSQTPDGEVVTTQIETAQAIAVGDPVEIRLGYNGQLNTEFRGYVRQLNYKAPLEIECEDAFYLTRQTGVLHSGKTTLEGLLGKCGLKVGRCEKLTISEFPVPDEKTRSDRVGTVLRRLKNQYLLSVYFDLDGKVYAVSPNSGAGERVKYELRRNTVSDDELKYHRKEDVKIRITAVGIKRDGTEVEASAGEEGGTKKKLEFYDVTDLKELQALADRELARCCRDGYTGTITTFLQPYAEPAMVAAMHDPVFPERDGDYFIESVETTFGTGGARRKIEIGAKL